MQELQRAIENEMKEDFDDSTNLRECAKKWSAHCLDTYKGKLLKKALNISA